MHLSAETPPPPAIDILARWMCYVGQEPSGPEDFVASIHSYRIRVAPAYPLALNARVRIIALSPTRYHTPDADETLYDAYDPHVIGRITRIMGWKSTLLALELENECRISPVRKVRLEVPYIPGVTVRAVVASRTDRGPRIANAADISGCRVAGQLPLEGRCGERGCAMRATALAGDGIVDEFWLPGHREPPPRKVVRKGRRKARGNMEATGWVEAD